MSVFSIFFIGPSLGVMLAARFLVARALGMKGITFLFGGAVENAEAATPARRGAVVLAALVASYLIAGVCFALMALTAGHVRYTTEVAPIPDRAAAAAGMSAGDRVLSVAGQPVQSWEELAATIAAHTGEPIEIVARRGDAEVRFTVTPTGEPGRGKIGVAPAPGSETREPTRAGDVLTALVASPMLCVVATARGMMSMLTGSHVEEVVGPVAIVKEVGQATSDGYSASFLLAVLSAMLANVWPLTALLAILTVPRRARR
jgi:regulator of sigma E protease